MEHVRKGAVDITVTRKKGQRWGLVLAQVAPFQMEVSRAPQSGAAYKAGVQVGSFIVKAGAIELSDNREEVHRLARHLRCRRGGQIAQRHGRHLR